MIKKSLITEEEEIQLLANVLTEECPISQRMLDIHYKKEMVEQNENKEIPATKQKYH